MISLPMLLQVFADPPLPPPPPAPRSMSCVNKDTIVNAYTVSTCVPGLRAISFGSATAPQQKADRTWMHRVPYQADKATAFETTICGIDLIDFTFKSGSGATINVSEANDAGHHCITKGFTIRPGALALEVRTRTKFPNLVIRSSVMPAPVSTILQPSPVAVVVMPPPVILFLPPPVPVVPPPLIPTPPPF